MSKMLPQSFEQVVKHCSTILQSGHIPMLYGKPGSGKSSLAAYVAKMFNLFLIDLRLTDYEPTDINGYMRYNEAKQRGEYVPMELIPIEGDPLPLKEDNTPYAGWLLLLDEITNADDALLKVSYKVLQDKLVAGNKKIHPNVAMMAAGNLGDEDGSMANAMPTTLQSRMVALNLHISAEEWVINENKKGNKAENVLAYLSANPASIHRLDMDSYDDVNFPCHRNWSRLCDILATAGATKELDEDLHLPLIAGIVGMAEASTFVGFTNAYATMGDPQLLIDRPTQVHIPIDEPAMCALMGNSVLRLINDSNVANAVTLYRRFSGPIQALCMRSMIARYPQYLNHPVVEEWKLKEGSNLVTSI